ncbi:MAG: hypothetical protein QXM76_03815, partial [Zestosphaera sp.]
MSKPTHLVTSLIDFWRVYKRNGLGVVGLAIIVFFTVIGLLAPVIVTQDPYKTDPSKYMLPPNSEHWFGTNEVGQDLFALNIYGSRISIIVGILAALVAVTIGTSVGLVSGYFG